MGKTRDLFQKMRDTKETLHAMMGTKMSLQMFKLDLEKAEEQEIKLPISVG